MNCSPCLNCWKDDCSSVLTTDTAQRWAGAVAPKPRPSPLNGHEALFDKLTASAYRWKKKRSLAFEISQMHIRPRLHLDPAELMMLPIPLVGWGGDSPPHTPTTLSILLPSPLATLLVDLEGGIRNRNVKFVFFFKFKLPFVKFEFYSNFI